MKKQTIEEIIVDFKGHFQIPKEFRNSKILTIRQPYVVEMRRGGTIQTWFRHKPQKPYISKGFIEINKKRFKIIRPNWEALLGLITS